jgi:hypothetical protein
MARIKDLIAAIISNGVGFNDTVRVIAAAAHSATLMRDGQTNAELGWLPQNEKLMIGSLLKQNVAYKKVNLKTGMAPGSSLSQSEITAWVRMLLEQLHQRDELHYPFAMIENQAILFISAMDLDLIISIAREQQEMQENNLSRPKGRLFKRANYSTPKE